MWDVILFDLDGTVTDPKEGITKCAAFALSHFGIHVEDPDTLTFFIGPPLLDTFMEYYGMSEAQALKAIEFYRQRFADVGWVENIPYSDIENCLTQLQAAGKTLMIATSKPEDFAVKILEHFGLAQYFEFICGVSKDKPRQTKADVIRMALEKGNVTDLSRAIMVGDRKHDILGAHEVGMKAIGVLYGYGDRKEHEENHADFIVENIPQLQTLLLSSN